MSGEALPTSLDDALNEIKQLRKKVVQLESGGPVNESEEAKHDRKFWKNVREKCKKRNVSFIRELLQDEKNKFTVFDKDEDENTLLHIAAEEGCYAAAALCINLDANITQENGDGETAIDLASDKGWFHVEQLLLFESMDAALGSEVNEYAEKLSREQGIIDSFLRMLDVKKNKKMVQDTIVDIVTQQIRSKQAFSDLFLKLAWRIVTDKNAENPLSHNLWKAIQETVQEILETKKEREWFWLKTYLLPSTIWLIDLSPPETEEEEEDEAKEDDDEEDGDEDGDDDDDGNEEEPKSPKKKKKVAKPRQYLFYELLKMVEKKAEAQIQDMLIPMMNKVEEEAKDAWQQLISWDIETTLENNCRQDMVKQGVTPDYSKAELSKRATTSATFNVVRHYDYNEYLSKLVSHAHMVDDSFHKSVQQIFDIDPESGMYVDPDTKGVIRYMRGPVKLLSRCKAKAETDYRHEAFPTSSNVLDINRCSLIFDRIDVMLAALKKLDNKVRYYQSGCIIQLCRDKNGFREYVETPSYADIKLNVLISGAHGTNVIGEMQFLLTSMMRFKHQAHSLYAITRRKELFDGMGATLPSLLDSKKRLFKAAGLGDFKAICDLMVTNGKSEKEILEYNDVQESILGDMCCLGHLKTLRSMKNMLYETDPGKQLFVDRILHRNEHGFTPYEIVTDEGQVDIMQYLFSVPEIKKSISASDDDMYRLMLCAAASDYHANYHCVVDIFNITDEQIKDKYFQYSVDYPEKDDADDGGDKDKDNDDDDEEEEPEAPDKYYRNLLFAVAESECEPLERFTHLFEIIDNDKFIDAMLQTDDEAVEAVNVVGVLTECCRPKILEFVFTTDVLRDAIVNDAKQMHRFLSVAISNMDWPPIAEAMNKIMFQTDDEAGLNVVGVLTECCRPKILEFVFTTDVLRAAIVNDAKQMHRFLSVAISNMDWPPIAEAMNKIFNEILNISDAQWKQYLLYEYPKEVDAAEKDDDGKSDDDDDEDEEENAEAALLDKSLLYHVFTSGDEELAEKFITILTQEEKLLEFLMKKDSDDLTTFGAALDAENFDIAHMALLKLPKNERAELLKEVEEQEDEEAQEKIQEWQNLL
eukprot:CAMPEP_0202727068 /NCGR_PEP_ID=MMETSP1385-20130828/184932_1 /ASSEMBLY_ACC=CAM_ASM_000861 /TAXON_ID=933848 /ORGANISM="Elphidium margaritaceum" /LENGTH=1095 /DNA_ID=CAMNT_0049393303 /DNA_START=63 /DNA_END=3350 /DNA_ORIENTATION=-